ncbi:MAG: serine/threonine-protein kinase [Planctomycetota bacterium]|nr:serine/threonine-protein kinase [Planctomycetota bacterium]
MGCELHYKDTKSGLAMNARYPKSHLNTWKPTTPAKNASRSRSKRVSQPQRRPMLAPIPGVAQHRHLIMASLQDAKETLPLPSGNQAVAPVADLAPTIIEGPDGHETFDDATYFDCQEGLFENADGPILETGRDFAGYTLREQLGIGSFGVVFRAVKGNQVVALKILKDEVENLEILARFEREAKVLAQLNHPNIVRVHDFGVAQDRPFIALEYLDGESLQDIIDSENRPDSNATRFLMAQVAAGLAYCHSQGIVHRDLKPDNIIIEKKTGRPVLVDFGLVYKDDRRRRSPDLEGFTKNLSIKGMIKGTPQFMAPEQAFPYDFGAVGAASDVWAFGATLYYLLTGELLFPGLKALDVLEPLGQGRVPKVQLRHPNMSKKLAQIIQLCLQQESIHRPVMIELKKSLERPEEAFQVRSSVKVLTIAKKSSPYKDRILILAPSSLLLLLFALLYYLFI